jgi:hypothetical protein
MNTQKGFTYYRTGAWILVAAGFAHALTAIPDLFISGLFSPVTGKTLSPLREVSLSIVTLANGQGTSFLESAWGAYIGFTISIGLLLGFFGLILVISEKNNRRQLDSFKSLIQISIAMTAIMVTVSSIFFFYLPTALIGCSLICFVLALYSLNKGKDYASG